MPTVSEKFVAALGKPAQQTASGMKFTSRGQQMIWDSLNIPSGWYKGRFLYLFGDELEQFRPCLDAWSFLVPPGHADRMIIGRNAYGALLVLEDGNKPGSEHIYLLDPFLVTYTTSGDLTLSSLVGRWLPTGERSTFTDDGVYCAWVTENEVEPELEDVLGFRVPRSLGGAFDVSNVQLDSLLDYYRTTGDVYAKSFPATTK